MNVVLAAEESAGLGMLRALAGSPHRLVAVLATPPKPGSAAVSVWNVAKDLGCPTWPASLVKDPQLGEQLRAEKVDILLNVHSLYIIHEKVSAAPKHGAFNLHPGPLPRYAGLNAVSWALFRGESTHGVTVHRIERGIDTGAIVYQSIFPIASDDTALSLSFKCVREGVALMLRLLEVAASEPENIPHLPQDPGMREYFNRDVPEGGRVCWSWPARKVTDFVRACDFYPFPSPWGHPRARLNMQEFALVKACQTGLPAGVPPGTVGKSCGSGVNVACGDEWVMVSKLLLGGKYLGAQEFLRPGDRLAEI
jgi:methionyl-tRNA formyltransferase